ncbi:MAG: N-acetylmuramic acid 6-phosphate etherase [Firmicutes bacterium]|nr:N-acetylmuramic acid 6-phosphate etherase [Bacillota bacterium]
MEQGPGFEALLTEGRNMRTVAIDRMETLEIVRMINDEDVGVALAVQRELPSVARAVDLIVECLKASGRLFYVGAGTSGRLGAIDASECIPTFGVSPAMVQAIMAGGNAALTGPVEGVEDDTGQGAADVRSRGVRRGDAVVGIAASGRTPYTVGALREAGSLGARTIAVFNNPGAEMSQVVEVAICPVTGPEAIMGSTRMKAGTAQKMVLNMLSTAAMIRLGKVYSNLMVDMQPTNIKLVQRARRMVTLASGCSDEEAARYLEEAHFQVKVAVVMALTRLSAGEAVRLLEESGGYVRAAAEMAR